VQWVGWIWDTRRQRWEKACEADGLSACSKHLGEIARLRGVKDRHTMMTGGGVPSFRPRGRGARVTDDAETAWPPSAPEAKRAKIGKISARSSRWASCRCRQGAERQPTATSGRKDG
jgi:hypothetical protein